MRRVQVSYKEFLVKKKECIKTVYLWDLSLSLDHCDVKLLSSGFQIFQEPYFKGLNNFTMGFSLYQTLKKKSVNELYISPFIHWFDLRLSGTENSIVLVSVYKCLQPMMSFEVQENNLYIKYREVLDHCGINTKVNSDIASLHSSQLPWHARRTRQCDFVGLFDGIGCCPQQRDENEGSVSEWGSHCVVLLLFLSYKYRTI